MAPSAEFTDLVGRITEIGRSHHAGTIQQHARDNLQHVVKTLRDLPRPVGEKAASALVISAGPSLRRRGIIRRILDAGYRGSVVAIDASYIACLREGLVPDYVVTMDPHPTRMVRWFGDHDLAENTRKDDYFARQDLDVTFRENAEKTNRENIALIDKHGCGSKAVVASSAPQNVVRRLQEAGLEMYWWNPLVDDPQAPGSITRALYDINGLPGLNTGGNVGSAGWVFAATRLKVPRVGLVGMDLGYYADLPRTMTQTYYELVKHVGADADMDRYFTEFTFPLTQEKFYTDPVYFWYRKNLLQLLEKSPCETFNCTEGGTLVSDGLRCLPLEEFFRLT